MISPLLLTRLNSLSNPALAVERGSSEQVPYLVVSGTLSIAQPSPVAGPATLSSINLKTMEWTTNHPSLYLYHQTNQQDSTHRGKVYSLLSNHTRGRSNAGELIVVGAFDTTCKDCQTLYCSVGKCKHAPFFCSLLVAFKFGATLVDVSCVDLLP